MGTGASSSGERLLICRASVRLVACWALALASCQTQPTPEERRQLLTAPRAPIQKTITSFRESLDCMDSLFIENDIRDVSIIVEDLEDKTKKVSVGTRDILFDAISTMTRRSGAIQVSTFGPDMKNTRDYFDNQLKDKGRVLPTPEWIVRGSISQLDESITTQSEGGAFILGPIGFGKSTSKTTSSIAVDLGVSLAKNFTLVPGVNSSNTVVIVQDSSGLGPGSAGASTGSASSSTGGGAQTPSGQGNFLSLVGSISSQQLRVDYNFSMSLNEGKGQAVRNLLQLASIELFGKLLRVPYWHCLGIADNQNPIVQSELETWYHSLKRDGDFIKYLQKQLRLLEQYNGPADNQMSPQLQRSIRDFLESQGRSPQAVSELELFSLLTVSRQKRPPRANVFPVDGSPTGETRVADALPRPGLPNPGAKGAVPISPPRSAQLPPAADGKQASAQPIGGQRDAAAASNSSVGAKEPRVRIDAVGAVPGRPPRELKISVAPAAYVYCAAFDTKGKRAALVHPAPQQKSKLSESERVAFKVSRGTDGLVLVGETSVPLLIRGWDTLECIASSTEIPDADVGLGGELQAYGVGPEVWAGQMRRSSKGANAEATWRSQ